VPELPPSAGSNSIGNLVHDTGFVIRLSDAWLFFNVQERFY
jgi:hypothetical protein